MIAWKFLARGAVAPFADVAWPAPASGGPGAWVVAPATGTRERGVHGCSSADLPYWVDEELWRIELADPVRTASHRVESRRGRLLERIDAWSPETRRAFARDCALRVRDFTAHALRDEGCAPQADALLSSATLEEVAAAASAMEETPLPERSRRLAGYLADALHFAPHAGCSSYIAAVAAAALRAGAAGADAERAWQARWLCDRLGIEA